MIYSYTQYGWLPKHIAKLKKTWNKSLLQFYKAQEQAKLIYGGGKKKKKPT